MQKFAPVRDIDQHHVDAFLARRRGKEFSLGQAMGWLRLPPGETVTVLDGLIARGLVSPLGLGSKRIEMYKYNGPRSRPRLEPIFRENRHGTDAVEHRAVELVPEIDATEIYVEREACVDEILDIEAFAHETGTAITFADPWRVRGPRRFGVRDCTWLLRVGEVARTCPSWAARIPALQKFEDIVRWRNRDGDFLPDGSTLNVNMTITDRFSRADIYISGNDFQWVMKERCNLIAPLFWDIHGNRTDRNDLVARWGFAHAAEDALAELGGARGLDVKVCMEIEHHRTQWRPQAAGYRLPVLREIADAIHDYVDIIESTGSSVASDVPNRAYLLSFTANAEDSNASGLFLKEFGDGKIFARLEGSARLDQHQEKFFETVRARNYKGGVRYIEMNKFVELINGVIYISRRGPDGKFAIGRRFPR